MHREPVSNEVFRLLRDSGPLSTAQISTRLLLSETEAREAVGELADEGSIRLCFDPVPSGSSFRDFWNEAIQAVHELFAGPAKIESSHIDDLEQVWATNRFMTKRRELYSLN